jgi:hypothetical protein
MRNARCDSDGPEREYPGERIGVGNSSRLLLLICEEADAGAGVFDNKLRDGGRTDLTVYTIDSVVFWFARSSTIETSRTRVLPATGTLRGREMVQKAEGIVTRILGGSVWCRERTSGSVIRA